MWTRPIVHDKTKLISQSDEIMFTIGFVVLLQYMVYKVYLIFSRISIISTQKDSKLIDLKKLLNLLRYTEQDL